MKIGITCYPTYGGSGVVATNLGRELAARGHEIHFISRGIPFRLQDEFNENLYYHIVEGEAYAGLFNEPFYALAMTVKMAEIIEEADLDILHVHYAVPHSVSAFLAKELVNKHKVKIVTTLHGTDITLIGNSPSYKPVVKFAIEKSDCVTVVSNWLKDVTQKEFGLTGTCLQVVYNFLNINDFSRCKSCGLCNREKYAGHDEKIITHISNFRPVKRIEDVISAFAKISKEIKSKLFLIGEGPEINKAYGLVKELNIHDKVLFLGQQRHVEDYLAISDLLLFPSKNESFGMAALEAMSYGIPVVGSKSGGLCEVVDDGKTGFLVPLGDVDALAQKSVEILSNPKLADKFARASIKRVYDNFRSDLIIPQYEAIYNRLVSL